MRHTWQLPEDYTLHSEIDLQNNKKQFWIVNGISLVILVLVSALGVMICPRLHFEGWLFPVLWLAGFAAYILLHELIHGIVIRLISGKWGNFGLTLTYAYAGSDCYFDRAGYLVIALAPIVLWGLVYAVAAALVPEEWFWLVWLWQAANLSGGAGDLYVTWYMLRLDSRILIRDTGVAMTVYAPEK